MTPDPLGCNNCEKGDAPFTGLWNRLSMSVFYMLFFPLGSILAISTSLQHPGEYLPDGPIECRHLDQI